MNDNAGKKRKNCCLLSGAIEKKMALNGCESCAELPVQKRKCQKNTNEPRKSETVEWRKHKMKMIITMRWQASSIIENGAICMVSVSFDSGSSLAPSGDGDAAPSEKVGVYVCVQIAFSEYLQHLIRNRKCKKKATRGQN